MFRTESRTQHQDRHETRRISVSWLVPILLILGFILSVAMATVKVNAQITPRTVDVKSVPILYSPRNGPNQVPLGIVPSQPPLIFKTPFDDSATVVWMPDHQSVLVSAGGKPLTFHRYNSLTRRFGEAKDVAAVLGNPGVNYKLRFNGFQSFAPSPDAKTLTFGDKQGVKVLDFKTGQMRLLVPRDNLPQKNYDEGPSSFAWSPNSQKIAFSVASDEVFGLQAIVPYQDLYLVGRDGKGLHRLGRGFGPSWSPDGRYIVAIEGERGAGKHIVRYETLTGKRQTLRSSRLQSFNFVSYSPNGQQLAIIGDPDPQSKGLKSLFLADTDGKLLRVLAPWKTLVPSSRALRADW